MKKIFFSILLLVVTGIAYSADGIVIVSKTKDLSDGSISSTNIYMTETSVALENKGAKDNSTFIFNSDKQDFTYVDHKKKEYYYFDQATMQQLKQQIKMLMMMFKQFSANMPEEQKKKLGKFMNEDEAVMEFVDTGASEKIGKWKSKIYEGTSDGKKATDMYIASFKTIGIAKDEFKVMESLISYFRTNLGEIAGFLPQESSFSQIGFDESSPVFKEGVPVKTISYNNKSAKNENIVESIKRTSVSSAMFQPPSGYASKKINMNMK